MFFFLSPFFSDVDGFSVPSKKIMKNAKIVEESIVEWTSIRWASSGSTSTDTFLIKGENIFS